MITGGHIKPSMTTEQTPSAEGDYDMGREALEERMKKEHVKDFFLIFFLFLYLKSTMDLQAQYLSLFQMKMKLLQELL